MKKTPQERFEAKVDRSGNCHVWTANKVRGGYSTGAFTHRGLATIFNVSHMTISAIVTNKTWKHVPDLRTS